MTQQINDCFAHTYVYRNILKREIYTGMHRNILNDTEIYRNVEKYTYYVCSNGGHHAAVIQADYHVMTNWEAT